MPDIGIDWLTTFYPALFVWVHGGNPYAMLPSGNWFGNPPWLLPLLLPAGAFGPRLGILVMEFVNMSAVVAVCVKARKPWLAVILAASLPMLAGMVDVNVDGIPIWGAVIGGPVGFFLLSVKPQTACLVGALWIWQAYRRGGWRAVAKLVGPTVVISAIFTAFYPSWIGAMFGASKLPEASHNFFPWLVVPGLALFALALRKNKDGLAAMATNMIAPYLQLHSIIGGLALLAADYPIAGILIVAGYWLLALHHW